MGQYGAILFVANLAVSCGFTDMISQSRDWGMLSDHVDNL